MEKSSGSFNTFFKPKPRSHRSQQRQNIDNNVFVTPKKRRRLEHEKKADLDMLFDKISNDPFYENELSPAEPTASSQLESEDPPSTDQKLDWLYDGTSDNEDTVSTPDLTTLATSFLEEEQTEQLKMALDGTELVNTDTPNYRFFNKRCKLPSPSLQIETRGFVDVANKAKYDRIIKYSQTETQQKLFLSSGLLSLWYSLGWQCPHSILRWLVEIVAFDKDVEHARRAKAILFTFWSKLPREKLCMQPVAPDDINYSRPLTIETFFYIMKSYGAINLPSIDDPDDDTDMCLGSKQMDDKDNNDLTDRIPLIQFEWILQLLQQSLSLWPEAYSAEQLNCLATTMVCLGMDDIGVLVLKHSQNALEACLMALPQDTWRLQVEQVAFSLCEKFPSIDLQARLPPTIKTTCPRSLYLRRTTAMMALEALLHKYKLEKEDQTTSTTDNKRTPTFGDLAFSLAFDNDLLGRLAAITADPDGIFQQTDPDYRQIADQICLLDFAVGNDYTELMTSIDAVNSLVTQLQAFSRKIGGCLGALSRTKSGPPTREYLYKILVVGDLGTGKTSIIRRYVHNIFSTNYKSTIGVDFALKVIQWSPEIIVRLQLWDIAGQERFGNMTRVYYKEALGAFVVYDVTRPQTFEGVTKWKQDLDSKISLPEPWGGGHIPVVLLANKSDLLQEGHGQPINHQEMNQFCTDNGFSSWFETSAKDNTNIDEAARDLIQSIVAIEEEHGTLLADDDMDDDSIHLDQTKHRDHYSGGSGCC